MYQPVLEKVAPLDTRTIKILKNLKVLDDSFDPTQWRIDEENKNQEIYDQELELYEEDQHAAKESVMLLAKSLKQNFTKDEYKIFKKSIDLYFEPYDHETPFGELKESNCYWSNGYKAHDYPNKYETKEERELESYYSTKDYFSLSEVLGKEGIPWGSTLENSELFYKLAEGWNDMGYDVYLAKFWYSRNYGVECSKSTNFDKDYVGNYIDYRASEDNDKSRIYIQRK